LCATLGVPPRLLAEQGAEGSVGTPSQQLRLGSSSMAAVQLTYEDDGEHPNSRGKSPKANKIWTVERQSGSFNESF
jgi:hypothetical protein